jgi:hypothetical protein
VTRFDTGEQVTARDGALLYQVLIRTGEGVREKVERVTMRANDIPDGILEGSPVLLRGSVSINGRANGRVYVSLWGNTMGLAPDADETAAPRRGKTAPALERAA